MKINELFKENEIKEKNDGNYQTICPDCGLQGGRTEGLILFPKTNTWYCHSSKKHGGILELYAIKKRIIKCIDCLETEEKRRVLDGELLKTTLDNFKEEYGKEECDNILDNLGFKRKIELPNNGKYISTFAEELAERIKKEQIFFYRTETKEIVEINKIKQPDGDLKYDGFNPVSGNRFITLIERYFKPYTVMYGKYGEFNVDKSMSSNIGNIVMESDNFRDKMPIIKRMFTFQMPIIYKNELTFPKEGYDIRFGSWLPHDTPKISNPNMPIEEAKEILNFILHEFCFQTKQDYINAIAGILTPFLRGLYPSFNTRTPVFIYLANRERAGKDYLAGITGILYEGCALEEPPISNNEFKTSGSNDELRKKILSALISGRKRLHFANNKGNLNNATFEGITTAKKYSDRLLGKNESPIFDNELEFSLSGNLGMTMTPDLANRSIFIRLFLDIEDANSRKFENPNLHLWILNNRSLILSALYSLVKNWIEKKTPNGKINFSSYPEWANICGGIMEAAEYESPCNKINKMLSISMDNETEDMKQLFEICYENMPDKWIKKADIKDIIKNSGEDIFQYIDWNNKSDQTKFGIKIDKYVGRLLSNIKLITQNYNTRKSRAEYKFIKETQTYDNKDIINENFGNLGNIGKLFISIGVDGVNDNIVVNTLPTLPTLPNNIEKSPKSDRQIQFWEADECKNIIPRCSKEEVLEWIKQNPGKSYKEMYEKLGIGSMKFKNELVKEGLIKQEGEISP